MASQMASQVEVMVNSALYSTAKLDRQLRRIELENGKVAEAR